MPRRFRAASLIQTPIKSMSRPSTATSASERPVNGRFAAAATSPSKLELPFVAPVPATPAEGVVDSVVVGVVDPVVVVVGVVVVVSAVDDVVDPVAVAGGVVAGVVVAVVVVVVVVVVSQTLSGLLTIALIKLSGVPEAEITFGTGPRTRSTWKKHGSATVKVYGPPALNSPSLLANSVCGNDHAAFGIA
jgi:hypothetical protein